MLKTETENFHTLKNNVYFKFLLSYLNSKRFRNLIIEEIADKDKSYRLFLLNNVKEYVNFLDDYLKHETKILFYFIACHVNICDIKFV